jgi:DNA-binding protein H-NS
MATLKALQDKIAKLQAQAEAIAKKESSAVFGKIRELMEKHGLTPEDIATHFRQSATDRKSATAASQSTIPRVAKYVDPKTGATWTGHGRAPAWIANAKNRDKYLATANNLPAAVSEKKPKEGNYARGPQAPKYRDPKSGATWSGRGPAPAWLAAAKDRTKFLIEKLTVSMPKSESTPTRKATRNAAAKKAAKDTAITTAAVKKASITKSAKKVAPAKRKTAIKQDAAKKSPAKKSAVVDARAPAVEPNVASAAATA